MSQEAELAHLEQPDGAREAHRSRRVIMTWLGSPILIGLVATALSLTRAVRPSAWVDEAATLTVSGRSPDAFWELLRTVDAVHALYYLAVRAWSSLFGEGLFQVRSLSAIAIGFAAGGLVVLAKRLGGHDYSRVAGWIFVAVPGVTWVGSEARSNALVVAVAIWSTVVLLIALERGRHWWVVYAATCLVGVALFAQVALVVAAHALVVLWLKGWGRPALPWLLSATAVAVIAAPFLWFALGQRAQVSWLDEPTPTWIASRTLTIWFGGSVPFAVLIALAFAIALYVAFRSRTASIEMRVAVPWLILPPAVLLAVSLLATPLYHPRYLVYCCAPLALIAAVGVRALPTGWPRIAWAAALGLSSAAAIVTTTGEYSRDSSDWSVAAEVVHEHAEPGTAVLFVPEGDEEARSPRRAFETYPNDFAGLVDIADDGTLIDDTRVATSGVALDEIPAERFEESDRILVLLADRVRPSEADAALSDLAERGYALTTIWQGPSTEVVLAEREAG